MMNKLILVFVLALTALTGCAKPEVNYDELFTPPSASITENKLTIKGGASRIDSAYYVIPHARIKDNEIYVYGTRSFVLFSGTNDTEKTIQLPKHNDTWDIYWINRDGSLIKIKNAAAVEDIKVYEKKQ